MRGSKLLTTNSTKINNLAALAESLGLTVNLEVVSESIFETINLEIGTGVTASENGLDLVLKHSKIFVTGLRFANEKGAKFRHHASKFDGFSAGDKLDIESVKYSVEVLAESLERYNARKVGA
jgi:hypothetical protein